MKIYIAGFPGGNLQERERKLKNIYENRLLTFYYLKQTCISIGEIKGCQNIVSDIEKQGLFK